MLWAAIHYTIFFAHSEVSQRKAKVSFHIDGERALVELHKLLISPLWRFLTENPSKRKISKLRISKHSLGRPRLHRQHVKSIKTIQLAGLLSSNQQPRSIINLSPVKTLSREWTSIGSSSHPNVVNTWAAQILLTLKNALPKCPFPSSIKRSQRLWDEMQSRRRERNTLDPYEGGLQHDNKSYKFSMLHFYVSFFFFALLLPLYFLLIYCFSLSFV